MDMAKAKKIDSQASGMDGAVTSTAAGCNALVAFGT